MTPSLAAAETISFTAVRATTVSTAAPATTFSTAAAVGSKLIDSARPTILPGMQQRAALSRPLQAA
jgi:hypothetical protein